MQLVVDAGVQPLFLEESIEQELIQIAPSNLLHDCIAACEEMDSVILAIDTVIAMNACKTDQALLRLLTQEDTLQKFNAITTSTEGLVVAVEGFGNLVSSVWDAIVRAFKRVWKLIVKMWDYFFGINIRYQRAIKRLRKTLAEQTNLVLLPALRVQVLTHGEFETYLRLAQTLLRDSKGEVSVMAEHIKANRFIYDGTRLKEQNIVILDDIIAKKGWTRAHLLAGAEATLALLIDTENMRPEDHPLSKAIKEQTQAIERYAQNTAKSEIDNTAQLITAKKKLEDTKLCYQALEQLIPIIRKLAITIITLGRALKPNPTRK